MGEKMEPKMLGAENIKPHHVVENSVEKLWIACDLMWIPQIEGIDMCVECEQPR